MRIYSTSPNRPWRYFCYVQLLTKSSYGNYENLGDYEKYLNKK